MYECHERNAQCEVVAENRARVTLNQDSRMLIQDQTEDNLALRVLEGAVFFDLVQSEPGRTLEITTDYAGLDPRSGTVFSVEAYAGTQTVNLYSGEAELRYDETNLRLLPGDHATMYQTDEQNLYSVADILASELHPFLLEELITSDGLCFESGQLQDIIDERCMETQPDDTARDEERKICTVEIRCDAVLGREEDPSAAVPRGGVILPTTPVKFTQGENVFEVLRRVCKTAGIPFEYKYLLMIGGHYITGIGGLEAGDYGDNSGWLYKVNGWYPNFGASKYEVMDGDVIVWEYSCDGGSADLGREDWQFHESEP